MSAWLDTEKEQPKTQPHSQCLDAFTPEKYLKAEFSDCQSTTISLRCV